MTSIHSNYEFWILAFPNAQATTCVPTRRRASGVCIMMRAQYHHIRRLDAMDGWTTAARPQKLRTCHPCHCAPSSLSSIRLACCKCTARSEMGKVVLRTNANQCPSFSPPHSPMSAMFGLWRVVVTVMEWSRLRWMPLNFKHTRSPSLPPFPHRLSAIALFLLPSPSS